MGYSLSLRNTIPPHTFYDSYCGNPIASIPSTYTDHTEYLEHIRKLVDSLTDYEHDHDQGIECMIKPRGWKRNTIYLPEILGFSIYYGRRTRSGRWPGGLPTQTRGGSGRSPPSGHV